MAIRFVDKEPEDESRAEKPAKRTSPASAGVPAPKPPAADAERPQASLLPGVSRPKPELKPRGSKLAAPLDAAPSDAAGSGTVAPAADGLLPGLQTHAKPTPKPRGRKKAFG